MTARIRWEPNDDGRDYTPAYRGYAGTCTVAHFVIYPPAEVLGRVREWVLRSDLPGQDHHFAEAPRREDLEPHAERWLEEFVSSLGVFFRFEAPVRPSLAGRRTRKVVLTVDTPEDVTDAELAAVFADMYADGPVLTGWWASVPEIHAVPYLDAPGNAAEARWSAFRDWLTGEARQCWRTARDLRDRPASAARFVIEAATNQGILGKMRELESGEERSDEDAPPANGNCPALFCSHLWSLHGPDGCTGKVFPAHSLTGKRCPCEVAGQERTEDGEPR